MANLAKDEKQMFQLVALQNFNGSFKLSRPLCTNVELDITKIKDLSQQNNWDEEAWVTTIVLAYLVTKLRHLEQDWELIAEKSKAWLSNNHAESAEPMFKKALELF